MAKTLLVRPFDNVSDPYEESVLAILAHLIPVLLDWRAGEDFRLELAEVESNEASLQKQVEQLEQQVGAAKLRPDAVFRDFGSYPMPTLVLGAVLVLVGVVAYLVPILFPGIYLIIPGVLAAAVGGFKVFGERKRLLAELGAMQRAMKDKSGTLAQARSRIAELRREIAARGTTFPTVTQFRASFPFLARTILGNRTLLDETGLLPSARLETVDLSPIQNDIDTITSRIDGIRNVPVLLSSAPDGANRDDAINTLYGEEGVLKTLVDDFMSAVGQIRDVELRLPLVARGSLLAQRCAKQQLGESVYRQSTVLPISGDAVDTRKIDEFAEQVNSTREAGERIFGRLKGTFDSLQQICESYAFARSASINNVHKNLFDVLNKASWCSKRFYCPRTIQAPFYLEHVLKVSFADAHKLEFDTLMSNLQSDPVIAARIKDKPELADELYAIYRAVYEIAGDIDFDEQGNPIDLGRRPAYIADQFAETLSRFRRQLNVVITGSANPVLTFSREAEMHYDPELDEWRSETVPYVYNTADMFRYGQVLKVTTDLLVPLWEHLWTEKADFRKSELFRTNDSLIRMTEKESEKLIEVANQFRADMRTVRENIYRLESEMTSKHDELLTFRNGMNALGLLSERQKALLSDEKLGAIAPGGRSVLEEGEGYETLLGNEPRQQAERRGTAEDPIDFVRSPDLLISYRGEPLKRLTSG